MARHKPTEIPIYIAIDGIIPEIKQKLIMQEWPKVYERLEDKGRAAIEKAAMEHLANILS